MLSLTPILSVLQLAYPTFTMPTSPAQAYLSGATAHVPGLWVQVAQNEAFLPHSKPCSAYPIRPQLLEKPCLPPPSSAGHSGLPRSIHLSPDIKLVFSPPDLAIPATLCLC